MPSTTTHTHPNQSSRYGHHTRRLNELIWLPRTPSTCPIWLVNNHSHKILLNQRIILGSHTTPHTPQSHAIGENNRRIVRNKASIYIVPNRTSAYDLHICAGQRCSHVLLHKVRISCNLLQSRESCTTWQPSWQSFTMYCVPTILHMIVYVQYKNPPNRIDSIYQTTFKSWQCMYKYMYM